MIDNAFWRRGIDDAWPGDEYGSCLAVEIAMLDDFGLPNGTTGPFMWTFDELLRVTDLDWTELVFALACDFDLDEITVERDDDGTVYYGLSDSWHASTKT